MLHNALKTSTSIEYAMLAGIQRVTKENIFSGLHNVYVCTVKDEAYAPYFGFTEKETKEILNYYGMALHDDLKQMYDGYKMGTIDIYNPWSLVNYATKKVIQSYWVNTSANIMIKKAMENREYSFQRGYEK